MYRGGYTDKVLRINLTDRSSQLETLPFETARDYLGGAGFCIKYLYDELPAGIDPLGAENKLIFAAGPFTGTSVPCASRMAVGAKSPLTGAMGVAMTGGHFPAELKTAGYDVVIIEGKADKPVYLYIKDDHVSFRDASALWGMKTVDCQQIIKDFVGDQNIRVASIGPAGENLSRMACIINEMRAAGRRGLGAVMGAKNLKALAIRGTGSVDIADPESFKTARGEMAKAMKNSPVLYPEFSKWGTP
ncbi:MAG: aldehyde ferredoxin oxidoreductase, partial [Desulfobacteraceae bacterium]|nr:aldehyde ferredoxin oxidoreductase [Desulfobacteraceae bacterium]